MYCANQRLRCQNKAEEKQTRWVEILKKMMRLELAHQSWPVAEMSKKISKGESEGALE